MRLGFPLAATALLAVAVARPSEAARLYPALAAVTPGVQAEVDRILAEERSKLSKSPAAGGTTLDEVLRELEATERSAETTAAADGSKAGAPAPPPPPTLIQQLRLGYS
ncbi:MAG: hypothetical protein HY303_07440, partial [Candidatus Wallbacteria bacterium]|nr:hypothetical protein [Candidatus Wallbacteria bacterium]